MKEYSSLEKIPWHVIQILMNDLDPSILKQYYKGYYQDAKELTEVSLTHWVAALSPWWVKRTGIRQSKIIKYEVQAQLYYSSCLPPSKHLIHFMYLFHSRVLA
jgi:hypothetical protein